MPTTALDPQMKLIVDVLNSAGPMFLRAETPEQARDKMRALLEANQPPLPDIEGVEDRHIPGPAGQVPIRIYTPSGRTAPGVMVFFHGGGWVLGDLSSHDALCRKLANGAGCVVVSVDYRLAPEHKFPAAAEDSFAAVKWTAENAAELGAEPGRIAVGGDSAGGNLAAATALMARDRGGPAIRFQLLIYPAVDASLETHSQKEFSADGLILSRADMQWFWGHYLSSTADRVNPYASPLRAKSLSGLPPALIITASHDPLRDEGEAYAKRLIEAGVRAACTRYDGVTHGFVSFADGLELGQKAIAQASLALSEALRG
ncbi:MAG TPA: alpha/beta hydrolase [Candidatus Binataceae bacterium]|nr:alpha/beta hydrolase [Candidatus Binataceae bacterium]